MRKTIYISLIYTVMIWQIQPSEYYISPSGDDSGSGNIDQPWKTLSKVHDSISSGDTVYFRAGVWTNEYLWPGKTVGLTNATFEAYSGDTPIFAEKEDATVDYALLVQASSSNLVFRGLTFSNNYAHVNLQRAHGARFENCTFGYRGTNLASYGNQSIAVYGSRFTVFTNCTFTHWGSSASGNDSGSFIHLGALATGETEWYTTNNYGTVIEDCTFEYGGHDCIMIHSSNNVVRNCKFFNPNWMPYNSVLYGNRHIEIITGYGQPNLIENNDFGYSGIPVDTPNTVASVETSTSRLILRKNRFFDNQGTAVSFYQKGYNGTPSVNYIYHNSMLWSGLNPYATTNAGYTQWTTAIAWSHDTATNNRIVNNAVWRVGAYGTNQAFRGGAGGSTAIGTSYFAGNLTNTADPLFVNTNTSPTLLTVPNLSISSVSPAVNAGVFLTTTTSADTGTTIPVSDAGYFYDGWSIPGETGDEIQLQGQATSATITAINYANHTLTVDTSLTWTNGQGIGLVYNGSVPDIGAYEPIQTNPHPPPNFRIQGRSAFSGNAKIN